MSYECNCSFCRSGLSDDEITNKMKDYIKRLLACFIKPIIEAGYISIPAEKQAGFFHNLTSLFDVISEEFDNDDIEQTWKVIDKIDGYFKEFNLTTGQMFYLSYKIVMLTNEISESVRCDKSLTTSALLTGGVTPEEHYKSLMNGDSFAELVVSKGFIPQVMSGIGEILENLDLNVTAYTGKNKTVH